MNNYLSRERKAARTSDDPLWLIVEREGKNTSYEFSPAGDDITVVVGSSDRAQIRIAQAAPIAFYVERVENDLCITSCYLGSDLCIDGRVVSGRYTIVGRATMELAGVRLAFYWSQGHNSYSYALNNPPNLVDPSGFEPEPPSGTGLGPDAALSPNNVSGAEEMKHLNIAKLKPAERMRLNSRKLSRDVRDKQREHPAAASGSSNGSTSSSGGAVTGKPHSDAGQPGSADGAKSTSAQPGTASAGH